MGGVVSGEQKVQSLAIPYHASPHLQGPLQLRLGMRGGTGDGEMERWRDGEMERWRYGEMEMERDREGESERGRKKGKRGVELVITCTYGTGRHETSNAHRTHTHTYSPVSLPPPYLD